MRPARCSRSRFSPLWALACAALVACSERPAARPPDATAADAGRDAPAAALPGELGLARDLTAEAGDGATDLAPDPDPAGQLFGVNVNPAGAPGSNPSAAELRAAGVRWVRVEWGGGHGFALYDPVIAALRAGGIKVLLLVDYAATGGAPASSAGSAEWASYRATFGARVTELAEHYGDDVDAWQIWNEPDFEPQPGYDPGVPAAEYAPLLVEAVAAIRPRSSRPIVGGSLASGNPNYWREVEAAAGAPIAIDALAVHPYGKRAPDDWPDAAWGFGNMSAALDEYLALAGTRALWITEIGTDQDSDPDFPADYLQNVYALVADRYAARVPHVFWFCWSDAMVAPFGLLDAAGSPKPSHARYRAIAGAW